MQGAYNTFVARIWDVGPAAAAAFIGAQRAAPPCPACQPVLHCPQPAEVHCSQVHCHCGLNGTEAQAQAHSCGAPVVCPASGWSSLTLVGLACFCLVTGIVIGYCLGTALCRCCWRSQPRLE